MSSIKVEDLEKVIQADLNEYKEEVSKAVFDSIDKVADEGLNLIKLRSPRSAEANRKHYADSWKKVVAFEDKESKRVILKNTQYQLTHLLENGHDIVRNNRKVGRAKAEPHIKKTQDELTEKLLKEIKEKL